MARVISELLNPENHTLRWETHAHFADLLLLIRNEGMSAQTYDWSSLDFHAKPKSLILNHTSEQKLELRWISTSSSGHRVCTIYGGSSSKGVYSMLCVYEFESLLDDEKQVKPIAIYVELARTIKQVISCFQALLLFLNHEEGKCGTLQHR